MKGFKPSIKDLKRNMAILAVDKRELCPYSYCIAKS